MAITSISKNIAVGEKVVLAIATITTILMLIWVLHYCNFGFDFTDESFYFNWISNPYIYPVSASQFGFFYHPLYQLVGGDIALFRQVNIIAIFVLAWLLCILLFRTTQCHAEPDLNSSWKGPRVLVMSAVLASTSLETLVIAGHWLPTPSYNSLAFSALLVAGIGVTLVEKEMSHTSLVGWFIIGLSGWISFMAKPTSALALGITMVCYLLISKRMSWRGLAVCVTTAIALLAISAWVIDGEIAIFINRLSDAAELAKVMGSKHTLFEAIRWDSFEFSAIEKIVFSLSTISIFIAGFLATLKIRAQARLVISCEVLLTGASLAVITGLIMPSFSSAQFQGLQVWAAPLGGLLAALVTFRGKLHLKMRNEVAIALCFMVFPHVYAFGSDNNYWVMASAVGFFWVISSIALLCPHLLIRPVWQIILLIATGAQLIIVVSLSIGMEHPYRQAKPLRLNANVREVGTAKARLVLSQDFAEYLAKLKAVATNAGFKTGEPMIDLTGHYPGALFSIGAKAIGEAWTIGGYPGSEKLATLALDRVSCQDISIAWVLEEPSGVRKLSDQILITNGIDLHKNYLEAGRLHAPMGEYGVSYEQILYRPTRAPLEANSVCQQKRDDQ